MPTPIKLRLETLEIRVVPAVTTSFDVVAGRLSIRSDGADSIKVSVIGSTGNQTVTVNGRSVGTAALDVKSLLVLGGPGANRINLAAVNAIRFPALTSVIVDAGAGNDTVFGSALADNILGGPGIDSLFGLAGNDTIRGGGNRDLIDGGLGDDLLSSSDPVSAAFNDTTGINADLTANSPYTIGADLNGSGTSEPGWATPWVRTTGDSAHTLVQNAVVFEGDGAAQIFGGTQQVIRDWTGAVSTGKATISQMIKAPAGGGLGAYVQDSTGNSADVVTAAQWSVGAGGTFFVLDSGIFEDTGLTLPVDTWTKVDVVVDMDAKTYEFYVNGVKYAAPDPIGFRGTPASISRINYLIENVPGVYIDAIQIDGPEAIASPTRGDTLRGGSGNDTLQGSGAQDVLIGGMGDDSLSGGSGNDTLVGGFGQDHLQGDEGNDWLSGGSGDDSVDGGTGNDTAFGGSDNDQLQGGFGADSLNGGLGNDSLDGGAGNDTVRGYSGDDTLLGGSGDDWLLGENGNDTLSGGGGADHLDGGLGDDLVESGDPDLSSGPAPIQAGFNDASGINADATANSPYTINSDLDGKGINEPGWAIPWTITAGDAAHIRVQNDVVFEGDAAAHIFGGTQQAKREWTDARSTGIVTVSQMINVPAGGGVQVYVQDANGIDPDVITAAEWLVDAGGTFRVFDSTTWEDTGIPLTLDTWTQVEVRIDLDARTYDFYVNGVKFIPPDPIGFRGTPVSISRLSYLVENSGGTYLDVVSVTGADPGGVPATFGDTLNGGSGNDTVRGSRGNDLLFGGAGNDVLEGDLGRDVLIGGRGADRLSGGADEDILIGGFSRWDNKPIAINSLVAEWNSSRPTDVRFANITGTGSGPRLNGAYFFKIGKVFADASRDTLTGGAGLDAFFFRTSEDDTDFAAEFSLRL